MRIYIILHTLRNNLLNVVIVDSKNLYYGLFEETIILNTNTELIKYSLSYYIKLHWSQRPAEFERVFRQYVPQIKNISNKNKRFENAVSYIIH